VTYSSKRAIDMKTLLTVAVLAGLSGACGDSSAQGGAAEGGSPPVGGEGGAEPICTEPTPVPCEDDVILAMNLKTDPATTGITSEADGSGFLSVIDATAGGAFNADPDSYTYGKFTDAGLEQVDISDEDALSSMDWDISFRRYVGRINSGNSGPSCVTAARLPGTPDYDTLAEAPGDLTFRADTYFTESCDLIADGTGLEGSPATALSSYWTYPGCVQMTGNVYVIQLQNGRQLKFTVKQFYNDDAHDQCQSEGSLPAGETGSGTVQVRWAFLP
jgi:HmuY protein